MVTLAEKQAARRAAAKRKLKSAGKTRATSLSGTVERTAQRRGRAFDPLATVIQQAVAPAPARPAAPPPQRTRQQQACDVLGGVGRLSGPTVSAGVSFTCGNKAINFSEAFPSNTSRRVFGARIQSNQSKLRAAGFADFIPFSAAQEAALQRDIKIARRKRDTGLIERLQVGGCKAGSKKAVSRSQCSNLKARGLF